MSLLDGLISYWKLDETSGGTGAVTRNDSQGSNNLTDNNTTPSGAGKINNCCDFTPANSEFLSVNDNASLTFTTAFSMSCWFNIDNLISSTNFSIITKWTHATANSWIVRVDKDVANEIKVFIADALDDAGSHEGHTTTAGLSADTWYHLVIVYNGAGADNPAKLKIYINNVGKTLTYTGTIPTSLQNSNAPLLIGDSGGTLSGDYFDGLLDEIGLWNRDLTAEEVSQLYNAGAGLSYSDFEILAEPFNGFYYH
jgi:hypothetical protein